MNRTLDEITPDELAAVMVEVINPETPFGGVQVFGVTDAPIQIVLREGVQGETGPPGPPGPAAADLPDSGATDRGTQALTAGQSYVDVAFFTHQPDSDYLMVECLIINNIDLSPLNIWPGIITSKTGTGFRLQLNGMPDTGNYVLHWAIAGFIPPAFAATSYLLTGPASGPLSSASGSFTVKLPLGGTVDVPVVVTLSDGGAGGTFTPATVTLTTTNNTRTFTYTPASYGAKTISATSDSSLTNPAPISFLPVSGTYTLSGPSSGSNGTASTNFTVALPAGGVVIGTVTVTPSAGGGGGTFTPTTVNLTTGAPSATFTYTPSSVGAKTISVTNDGGLTNPGSLTYTVALPIYFRSLTVDHTKVPSTQTDFPVLVSITNATLKTIANGGHVFRSDGFDIGFFSDSAGTTPLKWEVEKYDPATGELVAWVKIASLSSSVDTVFYLRYGSSTITTDQSDKVNVWTNSFVGVYHLGNGTTLSPNDSTGTLNGTLVNAPTATTGQIDGGGNFSNASSSYINFAATSGPPAMTVSCWAKPNFLPAPYNCLISKSATGAFFITSGMRIAIYWVNNVGAGVGYDNTGSHTLSIGTWYYLTASYDSVSGLFGYVNAVADGTQAANGTLAAASGVTRIASDPFTAGREWNGLIDEVRVASVARSPNWITTEYNNQNAPGTFITVGVET